MTDDQWLELRGYLGGFTPEMLRELNPPLEFEALGLEVLVALHGIMLAENHHDAAKLRRMLEASRDRVELCDEGRMLAEW